MDSIREVYEGYEKLIFRYLYGLTLNYHIAEELTQETFFQVVGSFHKFRGDSHVSTWLYKIARNVFSQYCRKNKIEIIPLDDNALNMSGDIGERNRPEEEFDRKEKNKILRDTLKQIPDRQREVLWLRDWQELSYKEIAIITGCSISWVKVNIHRGRLTFRRIIEKEGL